MEPISYFLDGLKTGKNGYNQSSASDANVCTFAQNRQFHHALKLPVLLVEATAPNPENAGITSATYAPKRSFFNLISLQKNDFVQVGLKLQKAVLYAISNLVPQWHKDDFSILLYIVFNFPTFWRKVNFCLINFYIISTARGVAQR